MSATGGGEAGSSSWLGWLFGAAGTIWAIIQTALTRRENSAKREGKQEGAAEVEQKRAEVEQKRLDEQRERLEDRDDNLRDEILRMRDQFGKLFDKLDELRAQVVEVQTNQNITNALTAKAIDSLAAKQERHSEQLADHAATLRLLNNIVTLLQQQGKVPGGC